MKIAAFVIAAALLLPGCATLREHVNCATAAKAKAAAEKTIETIDKLCPLASEAPAPVNPEA